MQPKTKEIIKEEMNILKKKKITAEIPPKNNVFPSKIM